MQPVYAELVSLCKARLRLGPSYATDPKVIAAHPLSLGTSSLAPLSASTEKSRKGGATKKVKGKETAAAAQAAAQGVVNVDLAEATQAQVGQTIDQLVKGLAEKKGIRVCVLFRIFVHLSMRFS